MSRHSFSVFADYHQFYVWDAGVNPLAPEDYTDDDIRRMVKVAPSVVVVQPVRNMVVPVELELLDSEPPIDPTRWDHIASCSLELPSGHLQVDECTGSPVLDLSVAPGTYQVRVLFAGLDTLSDDGLDGDDKYRIELWPGPLRELEIVKQWENAGQQARCSRACSQGRGLVVGAAEARYVERTENMALGNASFTECYRRVFEDLGIALAPGDACTMEELDVAERRLATSVPDALRSYFGLAGREARFNRAHNQLLPPVEWFIDSGHLVFLAENQSVVFWGIPIGDAGSDPPVSQGVNGDPIEWFPEHDSCSEFLCVMAHWQAVMGGFGRTWSAIVDANFPERLDGWARVGAVNGMHAFNRSGVALCWLRWDDDWRTFAASADDGEVERLSESLNVTWDPNYE